MDQEVFGQSGALFVPTQTDASFELSTLTVSYKVPEVDGGTVLVNKDNVPEQEGNEDSKEKKGR